MAKNETFSHHDPTIIPRPTGMDHEGNMVDTTDPAQPNPYYIHNPGVHGMDGLKERNEAATKRIEAALKRYGLRSS